MAAAASASSLALFGIAANPAFASYKAQVQNGVLQITGDAASDKLALVPNGTALAVDVGEDGTVDFSFDSSTFSSINVQAGDGDDTVDASNGLAGFGHLTINGGPGNDTIRGGDGDDTLMGGNGNDTIDGNRGNDLAIGGGGNDTFVWDPGDGSDVIEGQGGADAMNFNGSNASEKIDVSANGSRVRLTRDVAAIVMDLNGVESLNLRTLGGTDAVSVQNLRGTGLSTANVDLSSFDGTPDGSADNVNVFGTDGADNATVGGTGGVVKVSGLGEVVNVSGADALDGVGVDTLGGNDTIANSVLTPGPASINIDGGADSDTTNYNGTAAADTIGVALNGTAVATFPPNGSVQNSTNVENLVINGQAGDDTVQGQNGIASLTHLTINGGDGNDTLGGGDGADTLMGGNGNDTIDGNRGNDVAIGGGGNDTFVWDPGDGSDVLEGQSGSDALNFNGSNAAEKINVLANGTRVLLTRDIAAITMDFNGIEALNVRALGSADTVNVNRLTGTNLATVNVDLSDFQGNPDGSADNVNVFGTDGADSATVGGTGGVVKVSGLGEVVNVSGAEALDGVGVDTLGGDDTITNSVLTPGPAAVNVDGGEGSDTSTYNGTAAADSIGIALNGTAVATFPPNGSVQNATNVENFMVKGLGGDDTIQGQNGIALLTHLTIDGGDGNDTLGGGDGDDTLLGSNGNDTIDGNRGNDLAIGGAGNDTFVWDPGDGSDVLEGQIGVDTLNFNGSNAGEKIEVLANGTRVRLSRDIANINMDLNGIEGLNIRALGSADTITINDLTGTGLTKANVDLSGFDGLPDQFADTVIENGSALAENVAVTTSGSQVLVSGLKPALTVTGSEQADTLRVNTLGGKDQVTVAPEVSQLITPVVDLGADQ
ncbi:MAG TPA: calcium-binding protein [Solirubrobacteraceae bacterium]|nr:calcium-binding protein [Solirubrobacteraceae bacterium]